MNRPDFIKRLIRYVLLLFLAGIAVVLGGKAVPSSDCSVCPGRGICKGESDCSKFLSDDYGRKEK
jgi:hypothetical protein